MHAFIHDVVEYTNEFGEYCLGKVIKLLMVCMGIRFNRSCIAS